MLPKIFLAGRCWFAVKPGSTDGATAGAPARRKSAAAQAAVGPERGCRGVKSVKCSSGQGEGAQVKTPPSSQHACHPRHSWRHVAGEDEDEDAGDVRLV